MKLRIYDDAVAMVTEVRAYRLAIAREDADHARQLRRAAKSVPLNIAEGAYSRGRIATAATTPLSAPRTRSSPVSRSPWPTVSSTPSTPTSSTASARSSAPW